MGYILATSTATLTHSGQAEPARTKVVLIADARMDVQFDMTQLANDRGTKRSNGAADMTTATGSTLAEINERLCAEFQIRLSRERVSAVVHQAANDLSGAPSGALPELVERLARQRLTDQLS